MTMNGTSVAAPQVARQLLESFGPKTMTSTSDPPMTSASDPVSRIAGAGEAEIEQAARKSGDEAPKLATERAGKGRAIAPAGRRRRGQRDRRFGRVGPEGRR